MDIRPILDICHTFLDLQYNILCRQNKPIRLQRKQSNTIRVNVVNQSKLKQCATQNYCIMR